MFRILTPPEPMKRWKAFMIRLYRGLTNQHLMKIANIILNSAQRINHKSTTPSSDTKTNKNIHLVKAIIKNLLSNTYLRFLANIKTRMFANMVLTSAYVVCEHKIVLCKTILQKFIAIKNPQRTLKNTTSNY